MLSSRYIALGCLLAAISVGLGAFAAHGLKAQLSEYSLAIFQTGVKYQLWHSLALILAGITLGQTYRRGVAIAGGLFVAGIVLFSGSLYGLALTDIRWFGPVTPLGGLCFIAGWITMSVSFLRKA